MMIEMLKAKIHRAVVTEANLEYKGSITIDEDYMDEVGIYENEKVHVVNLNNGARIETYAIKGKRGFDTICLNGAAARYFEKNDKVIIMSYAYLNQEEVKNHEVKVKLID